MTRIPRDADDDYSLQAAEQRRAFLKEQTGTALAHVGGKPVDPGQTRGNIENLIGFCQVPLGVAGPLQVNGEHASGDFYVPMTTTEGTLVASYNRGMRVTREAGGITATVVDDHMQRAPVFIFASARDARAFGKWLYTNLDAIRRAAEGTTSIGKLDFVQSFFAARFCYLRFNYSTGDAAGQNMCGRATREACLWMAANYPGPLERWVLSGNMDTDKKHSQINTLYTRGKRVIAECVLPDALLRERLHVSAEAFFRQRAISNVGAMMAGSSNNGSHAANGIASVFIATGQDEANVAESQSAIVHTELTEAGDLYYSITLPSLIVATHGGGTGLPTQRECLEMMDCFGKGKARKLAEIIGATVLCGELSLGAAVLADEWVSSHEKYGRNRS